MQEVSRAARVMSTVSKRLPVWRLTEQKFESLWKKEYLHVILFKKQGKSKDLLKNFIETLITHT